MKTRTDSKEEQQNTWIPKAQQEVSTGGTATIEDNRPANIYQRKLRETMDASVTSKTIPIQRKTPKGSSQFQQIASTMGKQHGVDTSGLKATHNSSFPTQLNAEATIQGNSIHFAPGRDTAYNIRHEVAHAIDNSLHGTPKGDKLVNGQKVDTTREKVVDRMAKSSVGNQSLSVQRKPLHNSLNTDKTTLVQRTQSHADKVREEYQIVTQRNPNHNTPQHLTELVNRALNLPASGKGGAFDSRGNEMAPYDKNDASTKKGEKLLASLLKDDPRDPESPYTDHYNFLNGVVRKIVEGLGDSALKEFWNGGHIVFKDNGRFYRDFIELGMPLAVLNNDNNVMTKTELAGITSSQWNDPNLAARKNGAMMIRRPDHNETSHYKSREDYKPRLNDEEQIPLQYGVDIPLKFGGGHVLFGLDYTGHTFIQTEAGGFQNFYQGAMLHTFGFFVNTLFGMQSGLTGYSKLSEKGKKANVLDQGSTTRNQDSIEKILKEVRNYNWQ